MIEWKFTPYGQGEMKTNPTNSEFFTTTEVGNIATSLVREGIQNSLDEWIYRNSQTEKKPVHIVISNSGDKYALNPNQYKGYLIGLGDHLKAKLNGIRNLPDFQKEKMKYLTFEDFNTNGLVGNPDECEDVDVEDKRKAHNFYHFWRNVGITGKPEDKLGRWGVGKTVFPVSSRINSFFGLTIQKGHAQPYLLGQSVLKSHNLTANYQSYGYRPYGYFADYNDGLFPKAIADNHTIEKFAHSFRLKRTFHDSGLSIILPFIREEINNISIVKAVVLQYYFPIIKHELSVDVIYEDSVISINSDTIKDVVEQYWDDGKNDTSDKNSVIKLFDFASWGLGLGLAEFYSLKEQPVKNQPKWSDKLWENIDQDEIIQYFEKEAKIAFRVPVKYNRSDEPNEPKTSWFKVIFAKDESLKTAETHYIRENITIVDIKSIRNSGIRAMVLVEDKDLSNLLGDSENPAHTQWQKGSQNFLDKYVDGDKCINFVINSISNIYQKLQKPAKGLEKDLLKNIFFITTNEEDSNSDTFDDDSYKDKKDIGKKDVPLIPAARRQMVRVNKIPGGLKVFPYGISKDNLPQIELEIAYDTTRGNPLKKYQKFDFQLNKVPIKTIPKNCHFEFPESNIIRLNPYKEDFELTITGFDENRDLYFNLKTQYPEYDSEI